MGVEQPDVSSPEGAPALGERYAAAFAAHLGEGGESGLGAAYALGPRGGRGAVQRARLRRRAPPRADGRARLRPPGRQGEIVRAAAEFLRESLSTFEIAARGYHEVQEIARIEHEHVEQLRALADASVAINSSLSVEEILQLTADAARAVLGARARIDRDPVGRAAPPAARRDLAAGARGLRDDTCRALSVEPAARRARELGSLEVVDGPDREFTARDDAILTQLGQLAAGAIANARLYGRERTIARTLQRSLRPGALPAVPGLAAAVRFNAAGEGVELGGDFYDLFRARDGGWAALIGDIQGKGPEAAAVTALARHTLRAAAAYEHRPSGVLTLLHRELREQVADGRFCTVAYAYMQVVPGHVRLELACGGHPLPLIVHTRRHASRRSGGSARCWAPTPTRCSPTSSSSSSAATCSSSTPTASPRCAASAARCSAPSS